MTYRILSSAPVLLSVSLFAVSTGHSEYFSPTAPNDARAEAAALRPTAPTAATVGPLTDDDVRRIGRQAYVWGWPLVYVHNCRESLARVPSIGRSGGMPIAPVNELCMLTDYIAPTATAVPCPNQDVVYGCGIFDLAAEPVVVQVPDFGERFWVYQLGDQRTDGFADVGKMYGTKPGLYLVVGPDWNGATPEGIAGVFRCPTRVGYCLPRVFLDDTADDREAVLPIVNQIMAYPLGRFTGAMKTCDWSKVRWLPRVGSSAKTRRRVEPETFFTALAEVLGDVPPLPGEEPLYEEYRRLLAAAEGDAALKQVLVETAVSAENEIVAPLFEFRNLGTRLPHHWTTITNGAAFGRDYVTRTAVARSNIFVNRHNETKYFYQDLDAEGRRLDGRRSYRVTFAAGKLPPAKGFWSLTLYDERHAFYANELNRYSLGTKNRQLHYDSDGSLTIYVGGKPPAGDDRQANWLPAPAGHFSLYLRAYWPEAELLSGQWTPPAVLPAEADPAQVALSRDVR